MPEMPEMETYKRLLSTKINNLPITDVVINREKSINVPTVTFRNELIGRKVVNIRRRAKYLIFDLDSGDSLLLHLMLGGWMYIGGEDDTPDRTKQIILTFNSKQLQFIGLRLGFLHLLKKEALNKKLENLGPELNEVSLERWVSLLQTRRGKIKTTLINQEVVAGIGNLYSDEICYEAKVHPEQTSLTVEQLSNLYHAMLNVMKEAIQYGGYMDNPLYKEDNLVGSFYERRKVYDREGEKCKRCNSIIQKIKISSRKSYICPHCQIVSA